jgi:hypothetical protein
MKRLFIAVLAFCGLAFVAGEAAARVQISIDLSHQRMYVNGSSGSYVWPISTARSGYSTPRGSYAPTSLQRMHYSHKYHMSPMPYSIFFRGGYAIHGTYSTAQLGRPASHGCVRLSPGNAAQLFGMVKAEGASISISGSPPGGRTMVASHHHHRHATMVASRHHRTAPLAYAPRHHVPSVHEFQSNPFWR